MSGIGKGRKAMVDAQDPELARLALAIERLTQGLQLMAETQQTHSAMLQELLEAAAAPEPKNSEVAEALVAIAVGLNRQMASLNAVQQALAQLPAQVGEAVTGSLQMVLAEP